MQEVGCVIVWENGIDGIVYVLVLLRLCCDSDILPVDFKWSDKISLRMGRNRMVLLWVCLGPSLPA